jgi:hypothetical protein
MSQSNEITTKFLAHFKVSTEKHFNPASTIDRILFVNAFQKPVYRLINLFPSVRDSPESMES